MAKLLEIARAVEEFAPRELAMDYDNVGLIVGNYQADINSVMVCLDVTPEVVRTAAIKGCELILSHHPVIFKPIKMLDTSGFQGKIINLALKNNVNIFAAHTNLDDAENGLGFELAKKLKFDNLETYRTESGCLYFGDCQETLGSLSLRISETLKDKTVCYVGDASRRISRVAVVNGAGGGSAELFYTALSKADAYISAEFKHNFAVEATAIGKSLIQFSHFCSESLCLDLLSNIVRSSFRSLRIERFEAECPFVPVNN